MSKKLEPCHIGDLARMHGLLSARRSKQYKDWIVDLGVDKVLEKLNIDLDNFENRKLPTAVVWVLRRHVIAPEDINNPDIMDKDIKDFFPQFEYKFVDIDTKKREM